MEPRYFISVRPVLMIINFKSMLNRQLKHKLQRHYKSNTEKKYTFPIENQRKFSPSYRKEYYTFKPEVCENTLQTVRKNQNTFKTNFIFTIHTYIEAQISQV